MELFTAHKQWAERPADERFSSLQDLHAATKAYADVAAEKTVPWNALRTEAIDGDVQLVGKAGVPAKLTHWAFGQVCNRVEAPASYLRTLPPTLACQNLNHGLAHKGEDGETQAALLFHTNGALLLRSVTSDRYSRIWNYEVADRLLRLETMGWEPARPDRALFAGQDLNNTALYASDHDLFAFLRNSSLAIREAGTDDPLYRGVIVENSEVGASALKLTRFLYRFMCGNHIIWGASRVVELSIRHIGNARGRMVSWEAELRRYAQESASDQEAKIASAKRTLIAATKDEVLDKVFGMRSLQLGRRVLESSYNAVDQDQDGDPRSVWGLVQGITRHSQTVPYADERTRLDQPLGSC